MQLRSQKTPQTARDSAAQLRRFRFSIFARFPTFPDLPRHAGEVSLPPNVPHRFKFNDRADQVLQAVGQADTTRCGHRWGNIWPKVAGKYNHY